MGHPDILSDLPDSELLLCPISDANNLTKNRNLSSVIPSVL